MSTTLHIEYNAKYWPEHDDLIKKATGRYSDYSGMGFGVRDVGFYCKSESEANKLLKKIKKSVPNINHEIYVNEEE